MPLPKILFNESRPVPLDDERGWGATVTGILADSIDGLDGLSLLQSNGIVLLLLEPVQTTLANSAILTPTAPIHLVQSNTGFNVILDSSTPIANGQKPGQVLILIGNGIGPNEVTIPDGGTNVFLNGDITLSDSDAILLIWNPTRSAWVEIARNN